MKVFRVTVAGARCYWHSPSALKCRHSPSVPRSWSINVNVEEVTFVGTFDAAPARDLAVDN